MSAKIDYYAVLGVPRSATAEELKKAYKKQALVWHPDRHSNASEEDRRHAEERFKLIGEANDVLGDPRKKAAFDSLGVGLAREVTREQTAARRHSSASTHAFHRPASTAPPTATPSSTPHSGIPRTSSAGKAAEAEGPFAYAYQGDRPESGATKSAQSAKYSADPIGRHPPGSKPPAQGAAGGSRETPLGGYQPPRSTAQASDENPASRPPARPSAPRSPSASSFATAERVPPSPASGPRKPPAIVRKLPLTLEECFAGCQKNVAIERGIVDGASGQKLFVKDVIAIDVPMGSSDGQQLLFSGIGHEEGGFESAGDLILIVSEKAHDLFVRDGDDLVHEVEITLQQALAGCRLEVPSLEPERPIVLEMEDQVSASERVRSMCENEGDVPRRGAGGCGWRRALPR